ncbi:DNA ligase D [Amantichitinum ursilacus]|uniref:DNA ligase (ATP) n=1 Tax=Amantichitinum ursilacus TaxID=857265 RepID=A0A0N0GRC7_9NEIS|nr:DNA ligase D [Amantichitinum ursilacus]KPC55309.1 putative ATP-dependent DNA ligase YkoU [Amantichitinum ursilacus]
MAATLDEYNRKRDFQATPEPAGKAVKPRPDHALQYCIQKHDATRLHYDFRLELDGAMKSWAIPKGPCLDPAVRRLAVQVEDHPLSYASFEGHIPEGHYGAGDVIVWDRGVWIPQGDPEEGYRQGKLKFTLEGEKLAGLWNLVRTTIAGRQEQWFLIKHRDEAARPENEYDVVAALPDSVLSERSIVPKKRGGKAATPKPVKVPPAQPRKRTAKAGAQRTPKLAATPIPETMTPQLATLVESVPDGDWRYEIKFDGYRIMARIEHGEVKLLTRNGHDWTRKLPRQAEALASLGLESAWLDGEVIVANENGVPDFQLLQNAFESGRNGEIVYYLFDLPYLNGVDLRSAPLEQRRAALAKALENAEDDVLRFSEDFAEAPDALLNSACQMKLEGLIGKRAGSPYVSRRSSDWVKLKCKLRHEFVVVGYSEPKGARSGFGALLLGLYDADSKELRYAGKVGTGFNETTLRTIYQQLQALETRKTVVVNPPTGADARGVHWIKPELLAEVAYAEMTREGSVRHAVFHGLRNDKPAAGVTAEKPVKAKDIAAAAPPAPAAAKPGKRSAKTTAKAASSAARSALRITHPERVIDASSGTTKLQLAEYYANVAPYILPHLQDRPVALVRAPEGIAGELFFQKNASTLRIPAIQSLDQAYSGQPVMIINNADALLGAVQMSTIEFHTWNATSDELAKPNRFILDLDPDPALPWKTMVEAAQLTLAVLDELGLVSFIKTSGGKGLHIVVPLTPRDGWADIKAFSEAIVKHMARQIPSRFSAVSGPKNRVGKIFIDYLRNSQGATTICAYAARTRENLPVSVPIWREEIHDLKSANQWNIHNLHERLAELDGVDPWAEYANTQQLITPDMRARLGMKPGPTKE